MYNVMGFVVWIAIGMAAGLIMDMMYHGPTTTRGMTLVFGFFGAFIGGMLSMSGYLFHDPEPLRIGGLVGATAGAVGFTFLYHFIAKKVL
jgi:uncharacterized membrane protein YeaQ/YmgE (transglycosylase-associated protein family)